MTSPEERAVAFVSALGAINEAREGEPPHRGGYAWRNQAELVWECADDCPHPTHGEDE